MSRSQVRGVRDGAASTSAARAAGHTLLIVVVMVTIMIVSSTVAVRVWSTVVQREREEELIFRGRQYAMAIFLYRKNRGTLPADLKLLEEKGPKGEFIVRQLYKDPITGDDFGLVLAGPNGTPIPDTQLEGEGEGDGTGFNTGGRVGPDRTKSSFASDKSAFGTPTAAGGLGIMGVHSKSKREAKGPARYRDLPTYSEWLFTVNDIAWGVQGPVGQAPVPPGGPPPPPPPPVKP